ncbi:MAG: pyruvate kinase [Myxococcales bacterium]|nr:pyruvate kinase [Myxococcales bacterium]
MRKTKIIATIGPSTRSREDLKRLFEAGCNVVRVNMSHSSQDEAAAVIADVRTLSDSVGVLLDTRGPEVRTTVVEAPVRLEAGAQVALRGEDGTTTAECVRVSYRGLPRVLDEGTTILLADGQIELEVELIEPDQLRCRVVRGGTLGSKKGVNIPGVKLPMPFLSEQDMSDIAFACRQGVDFIAASFVGDAEDVMKIRRLIQREGGTPQIISKVESRYAVKNLSEIVQVSDGVMVARGDLGVEIPAEEVPVVQKQIIETCRSSGRTVIVATEMLESMITNPRPTRAETSDVANAIFEGTDAVMLSGETSVGKFPFDAVSTMGRIARIAESEVARRAGRLPGGARANEASELICKGAWLAARELNIRAILVPTSSGRTARRMSRYRPRVPILATTPDQAVARQLSLSYGVFALPTRHYGRVENMIRRSCQQMVEAGLLERDDMVAVVAGVPVGRTGSTNLLTLQQVAAILGDRESREA